MNIIRALPVLALYLLTAPFSHAALTPLGPSTSHPALTTLDFAALPTGTEANGLILDAVLFHVTKNSVATNGIVVVDGGPGTTGNIMPPNLVSLSDPNGVALNFNDVMIHDGAAALSPQRTRCGH